MLSRLKLLKEQAEEKLEAKADEIMEKLEGDGPNELIEFFAKKNQDVVVEDLGEFFNPEDYDEEEEPEEDQEMEDYDDDFEEQEEEVKSSYFGSYSALNFVAKKIKCSLDDLAELLVTSEKYKAALAQVEGGEKFLDPEFSVNVNSLCGYSFDFNRRNDMNQLKWERSDVYFGGEAVVYNTISSGDIMQGALGDCYFLAAISSIAEKPERLERLFLTKENNENGLFAVALCLNGVWEEVILDDYAPCDWNGKLAFNTSKHNELWVVLLEKAWAKVHGGYLNIEAGLTREALRDLTGASAKTYFTKKDPEGLWGRLLDAEAKQFVMTAGSDNLSGGSDAYIAKIGICGSHAYSLLAVYQVFNDGGNYTKVNFEDEWTDRIVKLRNPWGSGEWKGKWSDEDPDWNEDLKMELGFTGEKEDGIFFMPWEEFLKFYSDVQICYYHDGYRYSAEKYQSKRNETVFIKFEISEPGLYYFSVNQRNRRFYAQNAGYRYTHVGWVLGQDLGEDGKFVASGLKADKENWGSAECEPGTYYAMVHTPWRSCSREFSYSVYGPGLTELERIQEEDLPENFISKIFTHKAREDLEVKGANFGHRKHPGIRYVTNEKNGWAYVYFKNEEDSHQISVTLNFGSGGAGVRILPPFSGSKPTFTVGPGEEEIVLYKNNGRRRTSLSMMTSFRRVTKVDSIKEKVRESQTILRKRYNGEEVDIRVHFYYHQLGVALLYVNDTTDLTLNEDLEFSLDNAHIEGISGNGLNISLGPGKDRLIKVVRDGEGGFTARLSRIMYTISQKRSIYSNNKWW